MALTKHQLKHLNAAIGDAVKENKLEIKNKLQEILTLGVFPIEVKKPAEIHDFFNEKEIELWQI